MITCEGYVPIWQDGLAWLEEATERWRAEAARLADEKAGPEVKAERVLEPFPARVLEFYDWLLPPLW